MAAADKSAIAEGFQVFIADGETAIGAVREMLAHDAQHIVINIENAGDHRIPLAAIRDVHSGKVMLDPAKLDPKLRQAIRHAHDAEDPNIADRTE